MSDYWSEHGRIHTQGETEWDRVVEDISALGWFMGDRGEMFNG